MIPDAEAIYINEFITPRVVREHVPEPYRGKVKNTAKGINMGMVRIFRILGERINGEKISLLSTGLVLGDEMVEKEKEVLTDGLLDDLAEEDPVLNLFSKLEKKAESDKFMEKMYEAGEAQDRELEQFSKEDTEEIERITHDKGGLSAVALLYFLEDNPSKKEEEASYLLGATIQVLDDYMDSRKDKNKETLFTLGIKSREYVRDLIDSSESKMMEVYRDKWLEVRRLFDLIRVLFAAATLENVLPVPPSALLGIKF